MITINCNSYLHTTSVTRPSSSTTRTTSFLKIKESRKLRPESCVTIRRRRRRIVAMVMVDPWSPTIDSQSIASQLFAFSLFPYLGFLYFLTKSNNVPKLTLFGFYFLLAFVAATIPAGIYAKVHYGTSLSNVDWLHGGAESLLTLSNLFVVLGLRNALREPEASEENTSEEVPELKEENLSP